MAPSDDAGTLTVQRLVRHVSAADRLVHSSVNALGSFYHAAAPGEEYDGFLLDTLGSNDALRASTGSAAVTAELWHLSSIVPYLSGILGKQTFDTLLEYRNRATKWIGDLSRPLSLGSSFGAFNPLTLSQYAYNVAQEANQEANPDGHVAKPTSRSIVLGTLVLDLYQKGWPVLANVANSHPYVAARLMRAAERYCDVDEYCRDNALTQVGIAGLSEEGQANDALKAMPSARPDARLARRTYGQTATQYLWHQHGLSSSSTSNGTLAPSYDPVGACLSLEILIDTEIAGVGAEVATQKLARYSDLIEMSVAHILGRVTASGLLAYGLPFSYNPKGMGAFATSFCGLAALARALNTVFSLSRHGFYRNANWLDGFLSNNAAVLDVLFSLPPTIDGGKLQVGKFAGWSTDRAQSDSRIESWVTADVLSFAVNCRMLAQEVAQFLVIQRYGGRGMVGEPRWPYDPSREPLLPLDVDMQDPDELAPDVQLRQTDAAKQEVATSNRLAPIQVLHNDLRHLMSERASKWKADKSAYLLFGPPGTAKSTIAKSLAQELKWHFVELTPSNFVEHGLELIESRAKEIFEDLGVLRETVILFDELDSLLTDREHLDASSILNFSVPAMLPKLQTLKKIATRQRLVLFFATNFYDRMDPAMVRRGRVDERLVVLPFNNASRERLLKKGQLDQGMLQRGITDTLLGVFEDLDRYMREVRAGQQPTVPVSGITPALYQSRLPKAASAVNAVRSTERLALEICEVIGRALNDRRMLSADSSRGDIVARLRQLSAALLVAAIPEREAWRTLCDNVEGALNPPSL